MAAVRRIIKIFLNETIETDFNFEETSEETVLGLLNKKYKKIPKVMTKFPINY